MADDANLNQAAAAAAEAGEVIAPLVADDPLDQLHQVLVQCGVRAVADCNNIINHEGFNSIDDLTILEGDRDVTEMAKRMASHTEANGCVNLSTILIEHLQGLVYYVRDHCMHRLMMTAKDWMQETMEMAMTKKEVREASKDDKEPSIKDMEIFNPDYFDTYEDAFKNLMAQIIGVRGKPL